MSLCRREPPALQEYFGGVFRRSVVSSSEHGATKLFQNIGYYVHHQSAWWKAPGDLRLCRNCCVNLKFRIYSLLSLYYFSFSLIYFKIFSHMFSGSWPWLLPLRNSTNLEISFLLSWLDRYSEPWPRLWGSSFTFRHSTVGRTLLGEWSGRRSDLYLTTHNNHQRQTFMSPVGFEPAVPAYERPQTHALDSAATGIVRCKNEEQNYFKENEYFCRLY